jgi:GNAT superfamily N-acetyltransferase
MNNVILNPKNYTKQYLEYLNYCFPNWGQEEQYNWVFNRQVGVGESDILLLTNENNEVIAGSGITYRTIKTLNGKTLNIGVFTGSWTLPKARGRGCFSQIIQEFLELCKRKNIDYLTAYVTESNASYRRFKSIDFNMLQADNIFSNLEVNYDCNTFNLEQVSINTAVLFNFYKEFITQNAGYLYTKDEFIGQYINRNQDLYCIKIEDIYYLIEENETTVKVLYQTAFNIDYLKCLSNWSKENKDKKIMLFLTNKSQVSICKENHFSCVDSFFTANKTSSKYLDFKIDFESFHINLADKL